jgi:hypothetical protein
VAHRHIEPPIDTRLFRVCGSGTKCHTQDIAALEECAAHHIDTVRLIQSMHTNTHIQIYVHACDRMEGTPSPSAHSSCSTAVHASPANLCDLDDYSDLVSSRPMHHSNPGHCDNHFSECLYGRFERCGDVPATAHASMDLSSSDCGDGGRCKGRLGVTGAMRRGRGRHDLLEHAVERGKVDARLEFPDTKVWRRRLFALALPLLQ